MNEDNYRIEHFSIDISNIRNNIFFSLSIVLAEKDVRSRQANARVHKTPFILEAFITCPAFASPSSIEKS